jgi:hypothetical protein
VKFPDFFSAAPIIRARDPLAAVFQRQADEQLQGAFAEAWQDRFRRLLLEHADDPAALRRAKRKGLPDPQRIERLKIGDSAHSVRL